MAAHSAAIGPGQGSLPPSMQQYGAADGYNIAASDVQNVDSQLDAQGPFQQCCSGGAGGCSNIGTSGGVAVDLCSPDGIRPHRLCSRGERCGGDLGCLYPEQGIVEVPGLTVQI